MDQLENFSKVKILVVGDIMLDRYWWGNVERISPEAPVPVVHLKKTSLVAGGAANVAANIAGLSAEPLLIGLIGEDQEAKLLSSLLEKAGISAENLIALPNCQTIVKTRVVAHSQQIVRVDQESRLKLSAADEEVIWDKIKKNVEAVDLVLLSDYNKGILTENLLKRLITYVSETAKLVIVDPKGKNFNKYRGASILTPNFKEFSATLGFDEFDSVDLNIHGRQLIDRLDLKALLITQGEEGMTLIEKGKDLLYLTAQARKVFDVTGAGDTVIAALAAGLAAGLNFSESARIANIAAGLVVEQIGTSTIKLEHLKSYIENA